MKRYSPGASINSDYCYIRDCCEKEDGRPILPWEGLPERKCVKCKSKNNLQIDHVITFILGGMTIEDSLQTLCKPCNLSKGDR